MFSYENRENRKTRLSKETRARVLAEAEARDTRIQNETDSTAHRTDLPATTIERIVRDITLTRGCATERDLGGAREPIRTDVRDHEVKTGGNLGRPAHHVGWFDESDIYPAAKYIWWSFAEDIHDMDDLLDLTVELTRAEFIEILEGASRKGLQGTLALKRNGSHGATQTECLVMAFQPTPLRKVRERIRAGLEAGDFRSLRTWLQDNGRTWE